jgi:SAM-dependent methyltransferase
VLFGGSIFVSAFLLFLVQPLIGKFILPWFGGTPAVWSTCLVFFQLALLAGYAYAHGSIGGLTPRAQVAVHLALLAVALALLPIAPSAAWKPADPEHPAGRILLLLAVCLGMPYLALSATAPLVQAWFSRLHPGVSPYRLYALSNAGSLLALLSYPFWIEPVFSRVEQARLWSWGFGAFAVLCGFCAWRVWRHGNTPLMPEAPATEEMAAPSWGTRALWVAFPACGSLLLLAVTNKICQEIAVIPFLWVLPLGLYLLTFIISFDRPRWYGRWWFGVALAPALGGGVWLLYAGVDAPLPWQIAGYLALLFIACMVCHGETARLKPHPGRLTAFYLSIAAGGALGGTFVALAAPLLFREFFELHLGLALVPLLWVAVLWGAARHQLAVPGRWVWRGCLALAWAALAVALVIVARREFDSVIYATRNFYGLLKVQEYYRDDPYQRQLLLEHGATTHGLQFTDPHKRREPTSYFGPNTGIGLTLRHFRSGQPRHIGVVGLGIGTVAAYGRAGDRLRLYEINPAVCFIATNYFTYLKDTAATVETVLGDARLSLEREPPQAFDVLMLDAFSSDAVPVHLLTREAFEIYLRHLKPGGVIVVQISNRYVDLLPVVARVAEHFQLGYALIDDEPAEFDYDSGPDASGLYSSSQVLVTADREFLQSGPVAWRVAPGAAPSARVRLWTDDESNLFQILKFD